MAEVFGNAVGVVPLSTDAVPLFSDAVGTDSADSAAAITMDAFRHSGFCVAVPVVGTMLLVTGAGWAVTTIGC